MPYPRKALPNFILIITSSFWLCMNRYVLLALKTKACTGTGFLLRGGVIEILEWEMERSEYGENKPKEVYKEIQERNRRGGNIRI